MLFLFWTDIKIKGPTITLLDQDMKARENKTWLFYHPPFWSPLQSDLAFLQTWLQCQLSTVRENKHKDMKSKETFKTLNQLTQTRANRWPGKKFWILLRMTLTLGLKYWMSMKGWSQLYKLIFYGIKLWDANNSWNGIWSYHLDIWF